MSTTPKQVDCWLASPAEHQRLEFKEAKTQFDNRKLYRYCVAIANEGGGHLVLGVSDSKPRRVVGSAAFNDRSEMAAKIFQAIGFRVDIDEVHHPDGRVLVFRIPSRPRGTAYSHQGAYLMRVGEELQPMSEDQLRRIFAEGQPGWLEQPAKRGLSSREVVQLLDTQEFFDLLNLPYPSDQGGVIEKLKAERLVTQEADDYAISNLAAVLLAKEFRSFEGIARKAPRLVTYSGINKLETKLDVTFGKGYAVGFQGLVALVMSQLPQNEVIEGAIRVERRLLPEVVIREVLANSFIHQDFEAQGASPMVEVYENRVEISNPGEPVVSIERFIDGYQSRNERLADLMRRFGLCEEKSSGIDRVIQAVESQQLPAPDFQAHIGRTVAILFGPRPFKNMSRTERVRACYQHCVLQWVSRDTMTNQSLRRRFQVQDNNASTISQIITAATEKGLIKLDPDAPSSRKYARYVPGWA